jgi:Ni,Fe-hydrogenase III small subunit
MKPQKLRVYLLSHPISHTEWWSLLGDKYRHLLPFEWEIVDSPVDAQVLVWDGILAPKSGHRLRDLFDNLAGEKVLLLQGEATTLLADHPYVQVFEIGARNVVKLPGWGVLPEDLIQALSRCQEMVGHV